MAGRNSQETLPTAGKGKKAQGLKRTIEVGKTTLHFGQPKSPVHVSRLWDSSPTALSIGYSSAKVVLIHQRLTRSDVAKEISCNVQHGIPGEGELLAGQKFVEECCLNRSFGRE